MGRDRADLARHVRQAGAVKVAGNWLGAAETRAVCRALTAAGFQALFVGGCVRNALLGAPVNDIDIATDATPDIVTKLAVEDGLRAIPTGIEHGTVTVLSGGVAHEVTTFRRDVETNGRHTKVEFATSVAEDARRRDFTMNAIYAQPDGTVVDPLGGLPDLLARHLRFVGDPAQRIAEDYLRILRFFRFTAWYGAPGLGVDAEGLAACAANLDGIAGVSCERIGAEMRKLLCAPDPSPAVAAMAQTGVLTAVLPGADARALPVLVHLGGASWIARLAVLGGQDVAQKLRLTRAETRELGLVRDEIGRLTPAAALGWLHGAEIAQSVVLARAALFETPPAMGWQAEIARGAAAEFPVAAADLMPELQGAALGARLKQLENRWVASGFALSRAELLGVGGSN
tara:strand:- start:2835 stop:4034 length:1200 start_codon:yes stop_codon:yes gene_type:complete